MKRIIAAVLLLFVLVACDPRPGDVEDSYTGGPKAIVIGDSITIGGRSYLHADLGKSFATRVGGIAGTTYQKVFAYSEAYAADHSEVAVIALGTNDAWSTLHTLDESLVALTETYDLFEASCTVGITVTTASTKPIGNSKAKALNRAMALRADVVVDWDTKGQELGMTQEDTIHPTVEGYQARAEMIAEAARNCTHRPEG